MIKNNCDNTALQWSCHYIETHTLTEVAENIILALEAGGASVSLSTENSDEKTLFPSATELKGALVELKEEELQQWTYSTSKVLVRGGTKRKHNNEEHEEEDCSETVSQSKSSKGIKVGNAPNMRKVVPSDSRHQAGDHDDAEMITERLLLEEREHRNKVMRRKRNND